MNLGWSNTAKSGRLKGKVKLRLRLTAFIVGSMLAFGVFCSAEATDDANLEVVGKFLDAAKLQQQTLLGSQMEVSIDARLPRLEKQGRWRALRIVPKLGKITYKALGFSGDNTVKQEVIARYLSLETEDRDTSALAITPAN